MQYIARVITFSLCFFVISMSAGSWAEEPLLFVAKIRTPSGEVPKNCYELKRKGKPVLNIKPVMKVLNGDVIIPKNGKKVTLIYEHTACGEITVTKSTTVNCDPSKYDKPGWFLNLFSDVRNWLKLPKQASPRAEKAVAGLKGSSQETECFPAKALCISPYPVNGTTLLYGEPLVFRWDDGIFFDDLTPCISAKLVIAEDKSDKPVTKDIKVGELLRIDERFGDDKSYKWHIETDGKRISDLYYFRILSKEQSENIRSQMREIGEKYKNVSPELMQILYLHVISNATPGLDLYADSLRLLKKYSERTIPDKHKKVLMAQLLDQIHKHCLSGE